MKNIKQDRAIWCALVYSFLISGFGVALAHMVNPVSSRTPDSRFFDYKYRFGRIHQQCPCQEGELKNTACCCQPIDISHTQLPMLKSSAGKAAPYTCFYARFGEKEVVLCQPQPRIDGRNATITLECVKTCDVADKQKEHCKLVGILPNGKPCYSIINQQ